MRKFLLAALVVVVVVGALGIFTQTQVSAEITDQQRRNLLTSAELEANTLGQWILGQSSTVRTLSQHDGLVEGEASTARSVLVDEHGRMPPEVAALHYLNYENGTIAASTNASLEGADVNATNIVWANEQPFSDVSFADSNRVIQSWVYADNGEPSVALVSPVPDSEYALVMVIRTNKRAERFKSSIPGTRTTVIGRGTGDILFDANKSKVFEKYGTNDSGIQAAVETTQNGTIVTDDAVIAYTGVTQEDSDWVVIKRVPKSEAFALRQQVQTQLFVLIGAALLGLVALGGMVSRGPMRSLRVLSEQATAIADGELSRDVEDGNRIDEVGRVRTAFRDIKGYLDVVADQSDALARQDFDASVLDQDVPGRLGESLNRMQVELEGFIEDIEQAREASEQSRREAEQLAESLEQQAAEFSDVMTKAAAGDLTQRLDTDTENDAMRDIARQSNEMLAQLERTVQRIEEFADAVDTASETAAASADEIRETSQQVSQSVQQIATNAEDQNTNVEQVTDEMTDLSATVEEIASSADEVAGKSQTAAETGGRGKEHATVAATQMDEIKQKATQTIEQVERLDSEMERISSAVELIDEIADQTNILALNASIEAARAGNGSEAGDGFAVVASEIKELAEETQEATEEIEQMVTEVQTSTGQTVESIREMDERVDTGQETVTKATQALEEIVEHVTEANDGIQQISDATDDQAASTEEVVSMVNEVRSLSERTSSQAENAAAAAQEQTASTTEVSENIRTLSDRASELRDLVAEFETESSSLATARRDHDIEAAGED